MKNDFLNYLKYEKRRSDNTVSSYNKDLTAFEEYFKVLDSQLTWQTIAPADIRLWMESMMDKGNTATSINRRLSALRSFYKFAKSRQLLEVDPTIKIVGPKKEKPLPQFLKESEINTLLDNFQWGETFIDVRNKTIITTFYETGMRLSELIGLNLADINFLTQEIKVTGKRNKQRIIPFGESLKAQLLHYLAIVEKEQLPQNNALFITRTANRIAKQTVEGIVKKYLSLVTTLKKRSPHVLRHTFATTLLNNNAQIENVKELLGHQSLSTTEIYTHTTFEHLKKVYGNAHPRADINKIKKG